MNLKKKYSVKLAPKSQRQLQKNIQLGAVKIFCICFKCFTKGRILFRLYKNQSNLNKKVKLYWFLFFFKLKYPVVIVSLLTLLDTCNLLAVLCDSFLIILIADLYSTNNIMTNSQQRKLSYRDKNYLLRFTYLLRRKCRIRNWGIWQSFRYEGLQYIATHFICDIRQSSSHLQLVENQ